MLCMLVLSGVFISVGSAVFHLQCKGLVVSEWFAEKAKCGLCLQPHEQASECAARWACVNLHGHH
jgi:Zn-dependent alcohol dehydrogenase